MAYVQKRKNARGEITSYQVRWRDGGGRHGDEQSETFEDEPSAELFKQAVNDHGQHWPPGWVKGKGFITQTDDEIAAAERYRFRNYATERIRDRTGVEERYRADCQRELETYINPTFGECDVRSSEHFSSETIRAWVRQLEQTKVWRGSQKKPMSPKTIKNLHGLLSSILAEAVRAEPPLRARNPCEHTRLPRTDDDGVDGEEDVTFLTPQEVAGIVECLPRAEDRALVRVLYGTGFRWGELTALKPDRVIELDSARPRLRVSRAWKRKPRGEYYIGTPKTKRSRRTIRVSATVVQALVELGVEQLGADQLVFHNGSGERLPYSTFYDRWVAAVARAHKQGLLPSHKSPTIHDLRHSHAAALISAGHGLTYVQRRLGHESITTTSDLYGHLLPELDDDAMATIETSLAGGRPPLRAVS